jgi:dTDP-4-dehydrorhamnose 3,5-epimerase-like enzyme
METNLKIFSDKRGGFLIPFEFKDLPFQPKRIFIVTDVPKMSIRGEHAHYNTQQILICIKGEILVSLDYGFKYEEKILKSGETIFIDKMVWDYQKFITGHEVMCVIASTYYELSDYISDKEKFKKLTNSKIE